MEGWWNVFADTAITLLFFWPLIGVKAFILFASLAVNLQLIINMGIYKHCMQMYATGSSVGCKVWQQQEGRTCDTSPSYTWDVSVCCWRSCPVLWEWPAGGGTPAPAVMTACPSSCSLPPPCTGLRGHPRMELPFLILFIKSPHACYWDAAAPADYSIENAWCHHRVLERSQECPLHSKGHELPQQIEAALTLRIYSVQSSLLFMWTPRYL